MSTRGSSAARGRRARGNQNATGETFNGRRFQVNSNNGPVYYRRRDGRAGGVS